MPGNRPASYADDVSCGVGLPAHHGSCSLNQRPAGWGRAEPRAVKQGLGGGRGVVEGRGWTEEKGTGTKNDKGAD